MSAKVPTLSERFVAEVAYVGPLLCMLAEVIPQVAALAKHRHTSWELAAIVELEPIALFVPDLKNLILVSLNTFELFVRNLLFYSFYDYRLRRPLSRLIFIS